ncbi:hypothetical protein GCM10007937_28010 [Mesorhizobium albiziae]|uniref:hypothetical protein n=1 Tax=Neomesorhizobium albiziae TaxID=335020 RepID=UPI00235CB9A9|nr:hypothetical protein [Mesorhizobium albiziae]GLS31092.1 hypothetical protein GCM10007937_28010 [Mesorhizobium albiziae]
MTAGYPSHRGGRNKGSAADYSNKSVRDRERKTMGNAEEVYRRFVATWKQKSPSGRPGAANEVRQT